MTSSRVPSATPGLDAAPTGYGRGLPGFRADNRRADPHLLTPPAASTYPAHQIGVLSAGLTITWQR